MDSAGVGELVAINVAVKEKGGKFHMANFDEKIGKIIQMALIHKLIPTFDTQKDALAALEEDGAGE
jgi:anti-anti-sigma factor